MSDPDNVLDAAHGLYLLNKCGELTVVGNPYHEIPLEHAVVRIDRDVAERDSLLVRDDRRDVGDDTDVVIAHHPESGRQHLPGLAAPVRTDHAIRITLLYMRRVGT